MHKNGLWFAFLGLVCLATIWFTAKTYFSLNEYFTLKQTVEISAIDWSYDSPSDEEFIPKGHYAFEYKGKKYEGIEHIEGAALRNKAAADEMVQYLSKRVFKVWFDPSNPNHSSLQKSFPSKECLSTALLWGVLLYLIGLGYYVGMQNRHGSARHN